MDRRNVLRLIGGSSIGLAGLSPVRAVASTLSPLTEAGLDSFEVYVKMFASLAHGDECCWWFNGALPIEVDGIGLVDTVQEETIRVHRTQVADQRLIHVDWQQAGVFRDIATGEVPTEWINPMTGTSVRRLAPLKGGPSRISIHREGVEGLHVDLDIKGVEVAPILIDASIEGDLVGLTHTEDKTRSRSDGTSSTLRTVFKIYARLSDLRSEPNRVSARGFYGVRNLGSGQIFVNGQMIKTNPDEQLNPVAWNRIKQAHPYFFQDDRVEPDWTQGP